MAELVAVMSLAGGALGAVQTYAEGKTQEANLKTKANFDKAAATAKAADLSREGMAASEEADRFRDTGEIPLSVVGLMQRNLSQKQQDISAAGQDTKNFAKADYKATRAKASAAGNTTAGQLASLFGGATKAAGTLHGAGYKMPFG